MTKQELTSIGLDQYTDGWYYTADWNFAFDPNQNILYEHSEIDGSLDILCESKNIEHLKIVLNFLK